MDNQNQQSIGQEVLDKIKQEGIKMRPRFYFIFKTILLIAAFILTILFVLYISSFIVFSLRTSGVWFLPQFGFPGMKIFWLSLPGIPIVLSVVAIILLEFLARRFNWAWRRPVIYSLLIIVILAVTGGFLLEKASLHSRIFLKAQREPLPGIGGFYREFGAPQLKNARFGVVLSIDGETFIMQSPGNQTTTVVVTKRTRIPENYIIKEGDKISVLGKIIDKILEAFEVREIKGDFDFFGPPPKNNHIFPTTTKI
jgi:hypothetical protein